MGLNLMLALLAGAFLGSITGIVPFARITVCALLWLTPFASITCDKLARQAISSAEGAPAAPSPILAASDGLKGARFWRLALAMGVFAASSSIIGSIFKQGSAMNGMAGTGHWFAIDLLNTVILAAIVVPLCLSCKKFEPVSLYRYVVPIAMLGYAIASVLPRELGLLSTILVSTSYGLFDILSWTIMIRFIQDGRGKTMRILGLGVGSTLLGRFFGVAIGALLAALINEGALSMENVSLAMACIFIMVGFTIMPQGVLERIGHLPSQEQRFTSSGIAKGCAVLQQRSDLTAREVQVLELLARGKTAATIGAELGISTRTAQTHIKHVYAKVDCHTQQELIAMVEKLGSGR